MFADLPLRRQLLLWLLLPIALVWSASGYVTYALAYRSATQAYDRALLDSAVALAGQLRLDKGRVQVDLPQTAQKVLESDLRDRIYYAVSGPEGDFVMGHRGLPAPPIAGGHSAAGFATHAARNSGAEGLVAGAVPRLTFYYDAEYRSQPVRVVAIAVPLAPLASTGDEAGPAASHATVLVAETLNDRREMARSVLIATLVPELALMFALIGIVYFAVGRGLAPLEGLRREIQSRSSRDLTPVADTRAPTEVRRLVRSINDLLERMTQTLAAQRRFVADAAHQLRTPIAALKTQVELAQRATDPAETQAFLAQIHLASDRNARLVNQLLSLARAEPGRTEPMRHGVLDLAALAREETGRWVPASLTRAIDLGFEGADEQIAVAGDPVMLAEMLGNLVDNALRYTPAGGTVTVVAGHAVESGARVAWIAVEDDGPGVPQAERERVFERFHRVLGTGTEGAGLGLAIVREIAIAHGGRVELGAGTDGHGTRVVVTLPAAAAPVAPPAAG
jgi:two-component system, OmpR family, sensor histidine kinase TctE